LALEALGDYSTKKRREIIECWFVIGYEKHDEEIKFFPLELQNEICSGVEPSNLMDKKYDPIVIDDIESGYVGVKNEYIIKKLLGMGFSINEIEGKPEKLVECPCCRFNTLSARGDYDICRVCFWEDDGINLDEEFSGPNHITLEEGRNNFAQFGACDEKAKKHVDKEGIYKYCGNHT
jgi:hypothetical protein